MSGIFRVTRRKFLRDMGVGTGALVLGCSIAPEDLFANDFDKLKSLVLRGIPLSAFIAIKPLSGDITIYTHRSEMGQGIKSSLAAVLADEAELDWDKVTLVQADADSVGFGVPYPYPIPGGPAIVKGEDAQFTDSSRSMAAYYMPMRIFGAGLRLVMLKATAMKWNVPIGELAVDKQRVHHAASGRSIAYNHLLLEANKVKPLPEIEDIKPFLKKPEQFRYIGKSTMPFNDAWDMVTGKAVYGADVPVGRGMLTAMVVRCPVANGSLKSFDATAALAVPGVKFVEPVLPPNFPYTGGVGGNFVPHAGVAVIAENTWAALQGRRALLPHVQWDLGPNASYDSDVYRAQLEETTSSQPSKVVVRWKGDVDFSGGNVVEAGYYVPHLAQTPMEPPVAIARYEGGKWEIWSPTQGPELAQHYVGLAMLDPDPVKGLLWLATELSEVREFEVATQKAFNEALAAMLNVDEPTLFKMRDELKKKVRDNVKVHVTLLGGGFGRKSNPDYVMEAAFLARNHPGVPIRVQWTREDDIQFSFYNAVSRQYFKAALGANGRPTSLLQRSAFSSFFATIFPPPSPANPPAVNDILAKARAAFHNGGEYPYGSGIERAQGLEDNPYVIENMRIENSPAPSHIRCGWMRSVANVYHAFGLCSFADEMARAAGRDSKDYLLELIGQGHMFTAAELRDKEHILPGYDNNLFPVDRKMVPIGGQEKEVSPGYPPDTRRLRAVTERVARESGWDAKRGKLPKGRGLGIAAHRSFLSYVALVVDVSLNGANELTLNEVHIAYDCGRVINPDRVLAQMEGGVLYGLSLALFGEITVKNGAVVQHNFDDYPVFRIHQTPKIFTYFEAPSAEVVRTYPGEEVPPTGVGEPPTAAVAPALANAIVAAGGPRIREIPFRKHVVIL